MLANKVRILFFKVEKFKKNIESLLSMENPFKEISERLLIIESKLDALNPPKPEIEIINRTELCRRLGITEPTARAREKNGDLPCFRIGINVRYDWQKVLNVLGAKNKKRNK